MFMRTPPKSKHSNKGKAICMRLDPMVKYRSTILCSTPFGGIWRGCTHADQAAQVADRLESRSSRHAPCAADMTLHAGAAGLLGAELCTHYCDPDTRFRPLPNDHQRPSPGAAAEGACQDRGGGGGRNLVQGLRV